MSGPISNRVQVQKYRVSNQPVSVDTNATNGAQIGVNLWDASGNLITQAQWNALSSASSSAATFNGTTDDVNEGQWNLYFTIPRAQDAVGAILQNSANVTLSYVSHTSIKADLTTVTVGSGGTLQKYGFDAYGRLNAQSAATTDNLAEGTTNLYFTNRRAQDAIGSIVANSANVTLTYVGGTSLTADLTNVTTTTGGTLQATAFDAKGRLIQNQAITWSTSGLVSLTYTSSSNTVAASMNAISASTLLGNPSASSAAPTTVTIGSGLNLSTGGVLSATGGAGTVTSVGFSAPTQFTVSGSPITGSGMITLAWANASANQFLAGPTSGASAAPTIRSLVNADIPPNLTLSSLTTASLTSTGGASFTGNAVTNIPGNFSRAAWGTAGAIFESVGGGTVTDTSTAASTTVSTVTVTNAFGGGTYAASNTGVTYTNAATLYIGGVPVAGTNVTITNAWALYIASGAIRFGSTTATYAAVQNGGYLAKWDAGAYINSGSGGGTLQIGSTGSGANLLSLVNSGGTSEWLCDSSGNVTQSGNISASTVFSNSHNSTYGSQGGSLAWNQSAGQGEMDFINNQGGGAGGFYWYNTSGAGTSLSRVATLDGSGNFASIGTVNGLSLSNNTISTTSSGITIQTTNGSGSINIEPTGGTAAGCGFTTNGFHPLSDNSISCGNSTQRWSSVWAVTGTIQTSDATEKTSLRTLTDAELAAGADVANNIGIFQWLDAIAKKGEDKARLHTGVLAQQVRDIFASHGLDAHRYGLFCYDQWDATEAVTETDDEGNTPVITSASPSGERYGVRYDELHAFLCACFHQRLLKLEKALSASS